MLLLASLSTAGAPAPQFQPAAQGGAGDPVPLPGAGSTAHPAEAFATQALSFAEKQGASPQQRAAFLDQALSFAHQTWPEQTAQAHQAVGHPLPSAPRPTYVWTDNGARMWADTNGDTYAQSGSPKSGDAATAVVLAGWAAAGVPTDALLERGFVMKPTSSAPGATQSSPNQALQPTSEGGAWIPREAIAKYIAS